MREEGAGQDLVSRQHPLDGLAEGLADGTARRRRVPPACAGVDDGRRGEQPWEVNRRVRASVFLLGLSVLFVLALGACGGGGGGGAQGEDAKEEEGAETRTLPRGGPLEAGEYASEEFRPALSFRVGEGWEVQGPESPEFLGISRQQGTRAFNFSRAPREVFDPSSPAEENKVPAPEDWVAWFREHPYLNTTEPTPVSVGGVEGTQFDIVLSPVPEDYPKGRAGCPVPCLPLWPIGDINSIVHFEGDKIRGIVLEDVEGETVLGGIIAPEDEFDAFVAEAEGVLKTVEWGGADDGSAAPEAEATTTMTTAMETTAAEEAAGTLPEQGGPLPAGEYGTGEFEPAFSFRVGEGWDVPFPDLPDVVVLGVEGTQGASSVGFSTPKEVFDPSKPAEEVAVPAPETADGWVAWLQEHPSLDTGEPSPANVGGVEGTQLDVVVSPVPEDYPEGCGEPCVPGWRVSDPATAFDFFPGEKVRIAVLDVEGEPVLVTAAAPEEEFEGFLPEAQEVLDTVEWGSG